MAPLPHDSVSRLEAGQLDQSKGSTEKDTLVYFSDGLHSTTRSSQDRAPTERMPSAGRLIAMLLLSFLVTFGVASAISPKSWHRQPCPGKESAVLLQEAKIEANGEDQVSFKSLLESASPYALHELLHKYFPDRFKHGVWESDVSAVEALRSANEVVAVNIVQLAKRQDNGTTTSEPSTTPPTTTNPPATTSTPTEEPTTPSTTAPSTTPPSSTEEPGTTAPSTTAPGTTASPPVTTSQSPSSTEPSSSDVPSSPSTSPSTTTRPTTSPPGTSSSSDITESEPSSSHSTSAPSFTSSRQGTSPTGFANTSRSGLTSRPQGATTMITEKPTGRPSSMPSVKPVTSTFTSTNPTGGVVIVTATTYVPADPQQTEAPTSTRATPGLQNAAPGRQGKQVAGVGAGIVLGALLLI